MRECAKGRAIVSIVFLITSNCQFIYSYSLSSRERERERRERERRERERGEKEEINFHKETEKELFSFYCNGSDRRTKTIHLSQTGLESSLINQGRKGNEKTRVMREEGSSLSMMNGKQKG